jgi:hypothetical protein
MPRLFFDVPHLQENAMTEADVRGQKALDVNDAAAAEKDRYLAVKEEVLDTLRALTLPAGALCPCNPYANGLSGGGGSRSPITGQWIEGAHAPTCPHVTSRNLLAKIRGQS